MSRLKTRSFFPGLIEQDAQVQSTQAHKTLVAPVRTVKLLAMTVLDTRRSEMSDPPDGQEKHHQIAMKVLRIA